MITPPFLTFTRPLAFTWPAGAPFWAVVLWMFPAEGRVIRNARREQKKLPRESRDRSLTILVAGQQAAMVLSMIIAFTVPAVTIHPVRWCYALGVLLLVVSGLFRRHCFRMLGQDFKGAVTVRPDQPVVQRGAYRVLRHPSYLAGLIMFLGYGMALTNWASLAILVVSGTALYVHRIRVEERALLAGLGDAYAAYMKRTYRLVPGLW